MIKILITAVLLTLTMGNSDIHKALNTGSPQKLSAFFAESIDLTILDEEDVYSKKQAEQIIKKFFTNHVISSYEVVHTGSAKDGSFFEIGILHTKKKNYRTYFVLKGKLENQKIHQFRIEDDNE